MATHAGKIVSFSGSTKSRNKMPTVLVELELLLRLDDVKSDPLRFVKLLAPFNLFLVFNFKELERLLHLDSTNTSLPLSSSSELSQLSLMVSKNFLICSGVSSSLVRSEDT